MILSHLQLSIHLHLILFSIHEFLTFIRNAISSKFFIITLCPISSRNINLINFNNYKTGCFELQLFPQAVWICETSKIVYFLRRHLRYTLQKMIVICLGHLQDLITTELSKWTSVEKALRFGLHITCSISTCVVDNGCKIVLIIRQIWIEGNLSRTNLYWPSQWCAMMQWMLGPVLLSYLIGFRYRRF